jgi:predicted SpoU family rRNA methylase
LIDVDKKIINDSLDYFSSSMEIPIFELNDKKFQVFIIETTTEFDSNTMYASAYYNVTINEQSHSAATFLFDSFLTSPGDEVTAVWTFARLV